MKKIEASTRRDFLLKQLPEVVVGMSILASGCDIKSEREKELLNQRIEFLKIFFKNNYNCDVKASKLLPDEWVSIPQGGRELSLSEEDEMLGFLKREFFKYPPEYINQSRLKRVFILKDLQRLTDKEQGIDTLGFTSTVESLYIEAYSKLKNINQLVPWDEGVRLALIFHHELFHMADASDEVTRFWDVDDDEWIALNPKGINAYDPDVSLKNYTGRPVGFMEPYGLSSVREDQATVAQYLMANLPHAYYDSKQ